MSGRWRAADAGLKAETVAWLTEMSAVLRPLARTMPEWEERVNTFLLRGMHLTDNGTVDDRDKFTTRWLAPYLDTVTTAMIGIIERHGHRLPDEGDKIVAELVR